MYDAKAHLVQGSQWFFLFFFRTSRPEVLIPVGLGLTWDLVYTALAPYNQVRGAEPSNASIIRMKPSYRLSLGGVSLESVWVDCFLAGVSVAMHCTRERLTCFRLGYSFLTNRHGLALDNVVAFELVLPSGQIIQVSPTSYPDLFFGLKVSSCAFSPCT